MSKESVFLINVGEAVLFQTLSNAYVHSVVNRKYNKKIQKDQLDCSKMVNDEDKLDYFFDFFCLELDGERLKNTFKYYLKRKFL